MCKRFLIVASVMLMAAPAFAAVGIFDFTADVGNPEGIGSTQYIGVDRYLISGGGADIWGTADQFHYAYNEVSGNVRLSMKPSWQADGDNDWSKNEVMLRESLAAGSVHYATATRGGGDNGPGYKGDSVFSQYRPATNGDSFGADWWGAIPDTIGIQRITSNGYQIVQSIVDQGTGNGWEVVQTQWVPGLPDNLLAGIAVTSHQNNNLVQAWADDVSYDFNPSLVGIRQAGDPLPEACGNTPGFLVTAAKLPAGWDWWDEDGDGGIDGRGWQYILGEYLVKNGGFTGFWDGDPTEYPSEQMGTGYRALVDLYDTGGHGQFDGAAETSFPGIDAFVSEPEDPADGDDDNRFAVLVEACIELTEGLHVLGGSFDDGILLRIGGVEIGRTNNWDEVSAWVFEAPVAGVYSLEGIGFEGGGGAGLELYEYFPDGTRILLGDVAAGGSPVYVPEPATIALLGFGGLSMLRLRRKR